MATKEQIQNLKNLREEFPDEPKRLQRAYFMGKEDFSPNGHAVKANRFPPDEPEGIEWMKSYNSESNYGTPQQRDD